MVSNFDFFWFRKKKNTGGREDSVILKILLCLLWTDKVIIHKVRAMVLVFPQNKRNSLPRDHSHTLFPYPFKTLTLSPMIISKQPGPLHSWEFSTWVLGIKVNECTSSHTVPQSEFEPVFLVLRYWWRDRIRFSNWVTVWCWTEMIVFETIRSLCHE